MIQIYHNPKCTKSRECIDFLENSDTKFEVIKYLKDVPTFEELKSIVEKLNLKPIDLVRQKEKIWIENFKNRTLSDAEIIHALILHPVLIERPIVINGSKAIIARPLDNIRLVL